MMGWDVPQPLEHWSRREDTRWDLELWTRIRFGTFAWTPGNIGGGVTVTFTVAKSGGDVATNVVIGNRIGMPVQVTAPAVCVHGLAVESTVLANDTLTIAISNSTGGALAAPAGNWSFLGVVP